MKKSILPYIILSILTAISLSGCYILFTEQADCHARGGAYVKGFLTYECVCGRR